METANVFTDQILAGINAAQRSEDGNYYSVIETAGSFVIYQEKEPILYEDELLVAVYKDGEQTDWN